MTMFSRIQIDINKQTKQFMVFPPYSYDDLTQAVYFFLFSCSLSIGILDWEIFEWMESIFGVEWKA